MLNLENDITNEELEDDAMWEQFYKEIEEAKRKMWGKITWTPWGHADELRKPENHDFVRRLYKKGEVSADFLNQLGIKIERKR